MNFLEELKQDSKKGDRKLTTSNIRNFLNKFISRNCKQLDIAGPMEECHMVKNQEMSKVGERVRFIINKKGVKIKGLRRES